MFAKQKTIVCKNANKFGSNIVTPGCRNNEAEYRVTIRYSEVECSTFIICDSCLGRLEDDLKSHETMTQRTKL